MRIELCLGYQASVSWNVIWICSKIQLCGSCVGLLIIFMASVVIKDTKLIELMYNPQSPVIVLSLWLLIGFKYLFVIIKNKSRATSLRRQRVPSSGQSRGLKRQNSSFKWYSFICHVTIFFRWATLTLSRQVQAYTLAYTAEPSSLTMAGRESYLLLQMWGWFLNGCDWRWKTVDC